MNPAFKFTLFVIDSVSLTLLVFGILTGTLWLSLLVFGVGTLLVFSEAAALRQNEGQTTDYGLLGIFSLFWPLFVIFAWLGMPYRIFKAMY